MALNDFIEDEALCVLINDMDNKEDQIASVEKFIAYLKKRGGVSGHDIVALEQFHKDALSGRRLNSYTEAISKTNYQYSLENSQRLHHALKVGLVVGFATFFAQFILWMVSGGSKGTGGGGNSVRTSVADEMAKTRAMLEGHIRQQEAISKAVNDAFKQLEESFTQANDYHKISAIIIDNIKESAEILPADSLGSAQLVFSFDFIIADYIAKGAKPMIMNLLSHDSKDTAMVSKAKELIITGYHNLQKDMESLVTAFDHGEKPGELTDDSHFVKLIKAVASDCGVTSGEDITDYAKGISQHISESLKPITSKVGANGHQFKIGWKDISVKGMTNLLLPINDLLAIEEGISETVDSFQKESENFLEKVKTGNHADAEKLLYQDTIAKIRKNSIVIGIVLSALRNISRSVRYLEICVTRSINKLSSILKASMTDIENSKDLSDENKAKAIGEIKQLIHTIKDSKHTK